MDIIVRGRHLDVSDRFREHVVGKLGRIERFGVPISRIDVEVSHEPNPRQSDTAYEVELTCRGTGPTIRAEGHAQDKYAATDVALDRLEERLRRVSDKRSKHRSEKVTLVAASAPPLVEEVVEVEELDDDGTVWEAGPLVVRLKEHVAAPMNVAEAVESMELVGHDFYLFRDVESGSPSVLYRRRGYDYGLIRLEADNA